MKTIILTLTAPSVTPLWNNIAQMFVFFPRCFFWGLFLENNAAFCKTEVIFGDLVEWPKKDDDMCIYA